MNIWDYISRNTNTQVLYNYNGHSITEQDFIDALKNVGIVNGDTIFVHSDIKVFGKITITDKAKLLRTLVDAFQKSVGESGTVVMPTFSYSFCKKEEYNKQSTPSTVGVLTDFFRTEKGVQRSINPLFSVAVWGKNVDNFMHTSKDSFGAGTAFGTLRRLGGKIVLFGVDFSACTFLHHVEQMHGVPHRFMKTFEGEIIDGESKYHDSYTYFVRPLDGTVIPDFSAAASHMRSAGLLNEVLVGNGRIMSISAEHLYNEGMKMLDHNPYCFVAGSAHAK